MQYAIIQAAGKQHKVSIGQNLILDRQPGDAGDSVAFDQVLLIVDQDKPILGSPVIKNAKVQGKIVEHLRGDKIRVAKFKAKSRYRKVQGHRRDQTKIEIVKIIN